MQAVAILGAGELGATTARALAAHRTTGEVRLVDDAADVAAGKALDIWQAGAIDGSHTKVVGSGRIEDVAGASIVVVADRSGADGEWHGDAALERLRQATDLAPHAVLVLAGARQHALLALVHRELRVDAGRVLGTAPEAFASAVRAITALLADASPAEVTVPVLGAPHSWVFAWSEAQAGGTPLATVFSATELGRLEGRARACWPPGPYALGSAAAVAVHALLHGSARRFGVFAVLGREYGARGTVVAVPARLGPGGVKQVHPPSLSIREQVAFQAALDSR